MNHVSPWFSKILAGSAINITIREMVFFHKFYLVRSWILCPKCFWVFKFTSNPFTKTERKYYSGTCRCLEIQNVPREASAMLSLSVKCQLISLKFTEVGI